MEAGFWYGKRAPGVADQIDPDKFKNLGEVIEHAVHQFGDRPAYTSMGRTVAFNDVEHLSTEFAAYIQNHIYAFTVHLMALFQLGSHSVLIANPRDMDTFVEALRPHRMNIFIGLNTLFTGLMNHPEFRSLDFSQLQLTMSGGTALQASVAKRWQWITGCTISEGYGLSEASPVVSLNPAGSYSKPGTVGLPLAGTALKTIDDQGNEQPLGERGELCVKGPQVMIGYWQKPMATVR